MFSRDTRIAMTLFGPVVVLILLAVVVTFWLEGALRLPLFSQLFDFLRWLPLGILAIALAALSHATYRFWQWHRGNEPICYVCGGLLGFEHQGRSDRGGAFRKCYGCGKNVSHTYYRET